MQIVFEYAVSRLYPLPAPSSTNLKPIRSTGGGGGGDGKLVGAGYFAFADSIGSMASGSVQQILELVVHR